MKKRVIVLAAASCALVTLTFASGCSEENHRPALARSTMEQNAREAEEADNVLSSEKSESHGDTKASKKKAGKAASTKTAKTASTKTTKSKAKAERTPASAASSVYVVHVGAFRVKENAERMFEKVKGAGFPSTMRQMNHSKNGDLYVVALEPTPNKTEAETWMNDLKSKVAIQSHMVKRAE